MTEPSTAELLRRVKDAESALKLAREALKELSMQDDDDIPIASRELSDPGMREALKIQPERTTWNRVAEVSEKDREKCREVFTHADKDGSGKVSIMELQKMLEDTGTTIDGSDMEQLQRKMQEGDADNDGQLDFEEFFHAFCMSRTQQQAVLNDRMDQIQKSAAQEDMPPEQHVRIYGVRPAAVKRYIRKELDETSACLQLPQACSIFVFFYLAVTWHFNLDRLYAIDNAITWDISENANFAFSGIVPFENGRMGHKTIEDVNSIADFWSFMNMGIVPLFFPSGWDGNEVRGNVGARCASLQETLDGWGTYSEFIENVSSFSDLGPICPEGHDSFVFPGDTQEFLGNQMGVDGRYLLFQSTVGGVRLRQERVELHSCRAAEVGEAFFSRIYKGKCVDASHLNYWLLPELQPALAIHASIMDQPGGRTHYLLSGTSQSEVRAQLRGLENSAWFSPQTAKIELLFPTYNAQENLITATYVMFFVNMGGHIHKVIEPVSFYLNPYALPQVWVFDIIWASLTLKLFFEESHEVYKYWRQLGCCKGTVAYMNFSNFVDWFSIIFAFVIVALWVLHLFALDDLKTQLESANLNVRGNFLLASDRETFFDTVDNLVKDTHQFRNMLAIYPAIVVSRFFKAFSSQPRLALVTSTLSKASSDIFHFVVVFLTVFVVFTLSAEILWGQEVEEFSTAARSTQSVFRILLGDFDWEVLHKVGRAQAVVWFWLFMWLVNLVMLNMLLAIIMDVYTDVKGSVGKAETLWTQSVEIFQRWRAQRFGPNVSLQAVLKALDPTDLDSDDEGETEEEAPLYEESLTHKVGNGMPKEQAFHLLVESHKLQESIDRPSDSLTEATNKVHKIDTRTKLIAEQLNRLIQLQSSAPLGGRARPGQSSVAI